MSGQIAQNSFEEARRLSYGGDHGSAKSILLQRASEESTDIASRALLGSIYSWEGQYEKARALFNEILSEEKKQEAIWVSAIKNELYANKNAIALGLANKALSHVQDAEELKRLKNLAEEKLRNMVYPEIGWHNQESKVVRKSGKKNKKVVPDVEKSTIAKEMKTFDDQIGINNVVTVFNERYDPMFFSTVSYKKETPYGSIIPRVNYSNRVGNQGLQYDLELYPKLAKKIYAYLNYGYSNASIFPKHKMGGDLYFSLPGAIEFSAGGRYIVTNTRNVTGITNSLGHYRGNYYFSLRSFVTPRSDALTRVSGNLLVRRYLKDADNYVGISAGMGVSPELRQFFADDRLLAETILFIESQQMAVEYQFTGKGNSNIYKARLGVRRQELSFDAGNFFWGLTAGLSYQVRL